MEPGAEFTFQTFVGGRPNPTSRPSYSTTRSTRTSPWRAIGHGRSGSGLLRLHTALGRHLDDEERDAVPLIRSCVPPEEWEAHGMEVVRRYDRTRVPTLFGWACAAGSPEMVRRALMDFPAPIRLPFRVRWWPAYRRHHLRLYGTPLRHHADRA